MSDKNDIKNTSSEIDEVKSNQDSVNTEENANRIDANELGDISRNLNDSSTDFYSGNNAKKVKGILLFIILILIVGGITLLLFVLPTKEYLYKNEKTIVKQKATHLITYNKNLSGDVKLLNVSGHILDTINFKSAAFKDSEDLEGLFVFDNTNYKLLLLSPKDDKLDSKEILTYKTKDPVKYFYKNNKYTLLITEKDMIFVDSSNGNLIKEIPLLSISLNDKSETDTISKDAALTYSDFADNVFLIEDKLYFISKSIIYQYNIQSNKFDYMDFYKENINLLKLGDKLYLANKFGTLYDQTQIFIIDSGDFTVSDVITVETGEIVFTKNDSDDTHAGLLEIRQMESKESYKFFEINIDEKNEFVLSETMNFKNVNLEYCSKGYLYSLSKTSTTNNIIEVLDIYTLETETIISNNTNFVPIIK